jgi:hypothetical protein
LPDFFDLCDMNNNTTEINQFVHTNDKHSSDVEHFLDDDNPQDFTNN